VLNIDFIYESIRKQECILVIGPELVVKNDQTDGFFELFVQHLQMNGIDVKNLYNEDGFFHFENDVDKFDMQQNIVQYNKSRSEEFTAVFEKLAKIPFHLIFQVSSDVKLQKTYRDLGLKHKFLCYNAKSPTERWNVEEIDKDDTTTLISLLLDYDPDNDFTNDAVLSYEDFICFIRYFYDSNKLPAEILIEIKKARIIIFLGYRFDKWYWNLVFDLFNFPTPDETRQVTKTNFAILNQDVQGTFAGKTFYKRQYKAGFENVSIEDFIGALYNKFEQKGKLKVAEKKPESKSPAEILARQILDYGKNAKLAKAIEKMNDFEKLEQVDPRYQTTILNIIASYNDKRKAYAGRERQNEEFDVESKLPLNEVAIIREDIFKLMQAIIRNP
jgi:hypothetical protein